MFMIHPLLVRRAVFIWEFSFSIPFLYLQHFYLFIFLLYYVIVQWYKVLLRTVPPNTDVFLQRL